MGIDITKFRKALEALYKSTQGLLAYTLYSRYRLEPDDVIEFLDAYEGKGIININDEQRIRLTENGRKTILALLNDLPDKEVVIMREYPMIMTTPLDPFEPYKPSQLFFERYRSEQQGTGNQQ